MAALDATLDAALDAAVAPRRRLTNLFWAAAAWIVVVVLAATLANFLPIPSPTEMDMLARRMPPDAQFSSTSVGWRCRSASTHAR